MGNTNLLIGILIGMGFFVLILVRERMMWRHFPEQTIQKPKRLTQYEGDPLVTSELYRITDDQEYRRLCCPDCDGRLIAGPAGGISRNYACDWCHSEFNLTMLDEDVFECIHGQRISDKGPRELGERAKLYGVQS